MKHCTRKRTRPLLSHDLLPVRQDRGGKAPERLDSHARCRIVCCKTAPCLFQGRAALHAGQARHQHNQCCKRSRRHRQAERCIAPGTPVGPNAAAQGWPAPDFLRPQEPFLRFFVSVVQRHALLVGKLLRQ